MATRSFFILVPGLPRPDQFDVERLAHCDLLTQQDIFAVATNFPPALLFRVRSDGDPGAKFGPNDKLESCVGLLDAVSRWRTVFNLTRTAINAVRHPILAKACLEVMAFVSSQHPANISPAQRAQFVEAISKAAEQQMGEGAEVSDFDKHVALGVAQLAQADNDIEAAYLVPFVRAYLPFAKDTPEFAARLATIETMSGAVLLTEAANRLSERLPQWHFAAMPVRAVANGDDEDEE